MVSQSMLANGDMRTFLDTQERIIVPLNRESSFSEEDRKRYSDALDHVNLMLERAKNPEYKKTIDSNPYGITLSSLNRLKSEMENKLETVEAKPREKTAYSFGSIAQTSEWDDYSALRSHMESIRALEEDAKRGRTDAVEACSQIESHGSGAKYLAQQIRERMGREPEYRAQFEGIKGVGRFWALATRSEPRPAAMDLLRKVELLDINSITSGIQMTAGIRDFIKLGGR